MKKQLGHSETRKKCWVLCLCQIPHSPFSSWKNRNEELEMCKQTTAHAIFSPSLSKLLSPFCPMFANLCAALLKHGSLGWESSQSRPYSLLSSLKGYSERLVFCVWVGTLKCISHRQMRRLQRTSGLPRQACDCSPLESL